MNYIIDIQLDCISDGTKLAEFYLEHQYWKCHQGPLLLTWFNFQAWISDYVHNKVWDEITYPRPTSTVHLLKFKNG